MDADVKPPIPVKAIEKAPPTQVESVTWRVQVFVRWCITVVVTTCAIFVFVPLGIFEILCFILSWVPLSLSKRGTTYWWHHHWYSSEWFGSLWGRWTNWVTDETWDWKERILAPFCRGLAYCLDAFCAVVSYCTKWTTSVVASDDFFGSVFALCVLGLIIWAMLTGNCRSGSQNF